MKNFAAIKLIALTNGASQAVMLQWNMVNYPGTTAYILFRSADGVIWETAAANPVFRNYTSSTILAYKDHFSNEQKLYYRVKVYDINENIVEISNTAIVANPTVSYSSKKTQPKRSTSIEEPVRSSNGNAWQIFPNPVYDMLHLIYKSNEKIKGVINIMIQDETGKVVIRFRAASNNKQLYIPVRKLHAGIYFIKVNIGTDIQLNDRFIKQ